MKQEIISKMRELKAKYIGNGLYKVTVDGKDVAVPCEIDRVAMMYDDMVGEEKDGNKERKNGFAYSV
jgi:hypothetical protein